MTGRTLGRQASLTFDIFLAGQRQFSSTHSYTHTHRNGGILYRADVSANFAL